MILETIRKQIRCRLCGFKQKETLSPSEIEAELARRHLTRINERLDMVKQAKREADILSKSRGDYDDGIND